MERELTWKEIDKELARAAARIMEHADTVVIIATKEDRADGSTFKCSKTAGNYFAHEGAVRDWLRDRESTSDESEDC